MTRSLAGILVLLTSVGVARAQQPGEQPFNQKKGAFEVEALFRQEWTTKFFDEALPTDSRQRGRLMPRLIEGGDKFTPAWAATSTTAATTTSTPRETATSR